MPKQVFKFAQNVVTTGELSTSNLIKVIDSLPTIQASGSTVSFNEVDQASSAVPALPGVAFIYSDGKNTGATLAEIIADQSTGFNLYDVKTNALGELT